MCVSFSHACASLQEPNPTQQTTPPPLPPPKRALSGSNFCQRELVHRLLRVCHLPFSLKTTIQSHYYIPRPLGSPTLLLPFILNPSRTLTEIPASYPPRSNPCCLPPELNVTTVRRQLHVPCIISQTVIVPIETSHYVTSSHAAPPFENTRNYQTIVDNKGQQVQVDLNAKIDKGFFKAENDWTCYRRNYFSVACSYTLKPPYQPSREPIYLSRPAATNPDLIRALAVCITARVNGEDGKTIDLVQHTPKRDKGPLGRPEKIKLMPSPPGSSGPYSEPATLSPNAQLNSEYDTAYQASPPNSQSPTTANFDRIQFKNATANNGKRRAAQQYFNIVVELFAELPTGQSAEVQWVKVASRTSARMVVRGRSPGHYSDDRRGSSAGMGPGGGSGGGGAGPRDPNAGAGVPGAPRGPRAEMGITQDNSGRLATGAYLSTPASHHTYSSAESRSSTSGSSYDTGLGSRIDRPDCPLLSAEDDSAIQDQEGYRYFPSPLYEPIPSCTSARPHLPPVRNGIFKSEMEPPGAHHGTSYGLYGNSGVGHHTNPDLNRSSVRNGGSSVKSDIEPSASSQHGAGHAHPEGTRPIKSESHESSEAGSTRLWPLTSTVVSPSGGRHCGRFQGVETSAGFYPLTPALWDGHTPDLTSHFANLTSVPSHFIFVRLAAFQ